MIGILNLRKPAGVTSRDVVNQVQRLVRPAKVGHAGTLDPLASGVLVVCVGSATRLIEFAQDTRKTYHATFLLGRESDTDDIEGVVQLVEGAPIPTRETIEAASCGFLGTIEQVPPAYSAVKVAGRRAYALARAGQKVELAARPVEIHRLTIVRYQYPELELDIECGSGTYVRSLGRDLAQAVGAKGIMSALVRSSVGCFTLETAVDAATLTPENIARHLLPPRMAVGRLPATELSNIEAARIARGQTIEARGGLDVSSDVAAIDAAGDLLAILVSRGEGRLGPRINLLV